MNQYLYFRNQGHPEPRKQPRGVEAGGGGAYEPRPAGAG